MSCVEVAVHGGTREALKFACIACVKSFQVTDVDVADEVFLRCALQRADWTFGC